MKHSIVVAPEAFTPITVSISLESQNEVDAFLAVLKNLCICEGVGGSGLDLSGPMYRELMSHGKDFGVYHERILNSMIEWVHKYHLR